jgi:transcription elongation factor Elf1
MIDKKKIIEEFKLIPIGQRGWMLAPKLACPFCGKTEHISFIFGEEISSFVCKRCDSKGSIFKILKVLGRLDLVSNFYNYIYKEKIQNKLTKEELEIDLKVDKQKLPVGFEKVNNHFYLTNERGFTLQHFEQYNIGITKKDYVLKQDYVIFLIMENNECKGYVARSTKSKEEIEAINKKRKINGLPKYLRWKNSGAKFEKLVFGIDEITEGVTETVIVVEGITSKANVDKILGLFNTNFIKCVVTFGKKISPVQLLKIYNKGVKNLIFFYDPDALEQSKQYSLEAEKYFNVKVGYLKDKDPGDLNEEELYNILENLQSPFQFNISKVQRKELKLNGKAKF